MKTVDVGLAKADAVIEGAVAAIVKVPAIATAAAVRNRVLNRKAPCEGDNAAACCMSRVKPTVVSQGARCQYVHRLNTDLLAAVHSVATGNWVAIRAGRHLTGLSNSDRSDTSFGDGSPSLHGSARRARE